MKQKILWFVIACSGMSNLATAQTVPLTCGDFVLLTETAVQHRDTNISKEKSRYYLEDSTLTRKENYKVRAMIDRIYASQSKSKSYFVAQARKEC